MRTNTRLKIILAIWAVAYPVLACGPAYLTQGGVSGAIGNITSLFLSSVLLIPWLLGLIVIGALVWISGPRRYR
jgi:hypothetical protein